MHKYNHNINMVTHLKLTHCVRTTVHHMKCKDFISTNKTWSNTSRLFLLSLLVLTTPGLIHNILGVLCTRSHLQPCHPAYPSVHPYLPTVSVTTDNSFHVNHFPNEAPQGHPSTNDTLVRIATDDR